MVIFSKTLSYNRLESKIYRRKGELQMRKKRFNIVKALRKVKRMIKLGLIIALIFLILCLLLWLWDTFQNGGFDFLIKRHYNDMNNSITLLQEEIEMLKAKNSMLETDVKASQAMIIYQNELINDIQETINNPAWHTGGVQYHYEVVETTENYQVLEFEEADAKVNVPHAELPGFFSSQWTVPVLIGVGITVVKGLFMIRGVPAF